MNTWISRALAATVFSGVIAGCAVEGTGPAFAFGEVGPNVLAPNRAPQAQTDLLNGAITLVPPDGFCVDPRSKRANFALLARCDVLGGEVAPGTTAPLAIMTVSAVPVASETEFRATVLQDRTQSVLDRFDRDGLFLTRFVETPPDPSFNRDYWRGVVQLGDNMVSIAHYTSANAPALGPFGRVMLEESLTSTRVASAQANSQN